jgi:putative membrane protein
MRYGWIALVGALAATTWLAGVGPGGAANEIADSDRAFITEAAAGGQMEVDLGRTAAKNAADKRVKEFGQRMAVDHGRADAELKQLAARKNVTLPAKPTDDQRGKVDDLSRLKGDEFDRAYMREMIDDHEHDVAKFREAAKEAKDPDVKSFAAKTLPTLEAHLRMAKDVANEVHATTSGAGKGAR